MTIAITASTIAGTVVARYGLRVTAVTGMGCITAGLAWFSGIDADGGFVADLLGPELLAGFGFGLVVVAVTISATAEAAPEESGLVSGLLNVTQQVGMSIGIAVLITVATAVSGAATTPAALLSGYRAAILVATVGLLCAAVMLPGQQTCTHAGPARGDARRAAPRPDLVEVSGSDRPSAVSDESSPLRRSY